ncbi:putative acetyltransferase [Gammaproteobacteria bacterium]
MVKQIRKLIRFMIRSWYAWQVRRQAKECGPGLKVNGPSRVSSQTSLGSNVNFNGMTISGCGAVRIGDNFHSGTECLMIAQIHNYDHGTTIPYDSSYLPRPITIGANVWLGTRVMVLGGVEIGEGAIIQAGSVVVSSIPAYSIAGGHPARVFKMRNIEHYEELKRKGRFH